MGESRGRPKACVNPALVVHAEDYEGALRFFRDVLGMPESRWGRRVAGHFRVALEVDDCAAATRTAVEGGATPVAAPH